MKPFGNRPIAVVGGGPAGGFCAFLLSRAGFPVVLYEAAEKVERKVCGEYLSPAASRLFAEAGLAGFLSERFPALDGISFHVPNGLEVKAEFPNSQGYRYQGYALDRVTLEEELLRLSRNSGAEVRMGCRVRSFRPEADGWDLLLENGESEKAGLLIGADGRRSAVAKALGLHRHLVSSRVALHCFLPGELSEPRYGQMHFFEDGAYLGLNDSPAGTVNFSLVCDVSRLKELGEAKAVVADYLRRSPSLLGDLVWKESTPVHTTYPIQHSVRGSIGPRAALIGDAGGLIDPLTGEGIYLALWSASCLAAQLVAMRERGDEAVDRCLKKYAAARSKNFRWKNRLSVFFQWALKKPGVVNGIAKYLKRKPERATAFIGMMGHLYSPWAGIRKIVLGSNL